MHILRRKGGKSSLPSLRTENAAQSFGKDFVRASGFAAKECLMRKPRGTWKGMMAAAVCCLSLFVGGCGYELDGYSSSSSRAVSVLGDGNQTLRIDKVEQVTMYPWVQYYLRGLARDEVNLRRLARWVDSGNADYLLTITMPGFRVRSSVSNSVDNTLLSDTVVQLELVVRSGKNGTVVWRSGVISYFDKYETVDEGNAIRDGLKEALRRAFDRMQQKF